MKYTKKGLLAIITLMTFSLLSQAQNVGIGINVPTSKLHVFQPTAGVRGLLVDKDGTEDGIHIDLDNTSGGFGNGIEIDFNSNTVSSSAFWFKNYGGFGGMNIDNWGDAFGLQVWNRSTTSGKTTIQATQEGTGFVNTFVTNPTHADTAFYFLQEGSGMGMVVASNATGIGSPALLAQAGYRGIYGFGSSTTAAQGCGVYGRSGSYSGLIGSSGSGSTYGIFSFGDYGGTGAKYFVIDHPIDPANKTLKHFCIESDEPLLIYRGTEVFDANGEAVVQLKDYVQAINIDYSYQLTPIGQWMKLFVSEEVGANGTFTIAGGEPGKKVSWTLYGERNDAYFQAHPEKLQVEIPKTGEMSGKYLDPVSHGQPLEAGVDQEPEGMQRTSGTRFSGERFRSREGAK